MTAADAMAFNRLELFATTIAVALLGEEDLPRESLKRLVLARYEAAGGHLSGQAWESPGNLLAPDDPLLSDLVTASVHLIGVADGKAADNAKNAEEEERRWRIESRGLVLGPGDSLPVHSHPGWDWETSFFLDAGIAPGDPESSGHLDFQDPRGAAPVMYAPHLTYDAPGGETLGISQSMTPKTGALVAYPAWLLHSVANHRGAGLRISVTLRFAAVQSLDPRDKTP